MPTTRGSQTLNNSAQQNYPIVMLPAPDGKKYPAMQMPGGVYKFISPNGNDPFALPKTPLANDEAKYGPIVSRKVQGGLTTVVYKDGGDGKPLTRQYTGAKDDYGVTVGATPAPRPMRGAPKATPNLGRPVPGVPIVGTGAQDPGASWGAYASSPQAKKDFDHWQQNGVLGYDPQTGQSRLYDKSNPADVKKMAQAKNMPMVWDPYLERERPYDPKNPDDRRLMTKNGVNTGIAALHEAPERPEHAFFTELGNREDDFNQATGKFFDETLPQAAQKTAQGLGDLLTFYNPADLGATQARKIAQMQGRKLSPLEDKFLSIPSNFSHGIANIAVGIPMGAINTAQAVGANVAGAITGDPIKKKAANDYADKIVKGMVGGMVGVPDLDPNSEQARKGWFVNGMQAGVALRHGDLDGAKAHGKQVLTSLAEGAVDDPAAAVLAILPVVHFGGMAIDGTVAKMGNRAAKYRNFAAEAKANGNTAGYQSAMAKAQKWSDAQTKLQSATDFSTMRNTLKTGLKQTGAAVKAGVQQTGTALKAGAQQMGAALTPPVGPQLAPAGGLRGVSLQGYTNPPKPQPTMFSNVVPTPGSSPSPQLPVSSSQVIGSYHPGKRLDIPALGDHKVVDAIPGQKVRIRPVGALDTSQDSHFKPKELDFVVRHPGESHLSLEDFNRQRIGDLYDFVINDRQSGNPATHIQFPLRPLTPTEIQDYYNALNLDLSGYSHVLDSHDLYHIIKGHDASSTSAKVPQDKRLSRQHYVMINDVLNSPTHIQDGLKAANPTGKTATQAIPKPMGKQKKPATKSARKQAVLAAAAPPPSQPITSISLTKHFPNANPTLRNTNANLQKLTYITTIQEKNKYLAPKTLYIP